MKYRKQFLLATGVIGAVGAAGLAQFASAPNAMAAEFYAGKTITVLVGLTPGSGPDISARFNAIHIAKFIPGSPKFVVKNMPGARFQKAQGFVYEQAKDDGLTFYAGPWSWISQVIGDKSLRVRYEKFTYIGSAQNPGRVMYMRHDAVPGGKVTAPTDITKVKGLKFGGSGPTVGFDIVARLTFEMLGLNYNYVPGYRGSNRTRQAVARGELNIGIDSPIPWNFAITPTMVDKGIVAPLWAYPNEVGEGQMVTDPNFPKLMDFIEGYKAIKGKAPSGIQWEAMKISLGYARMGHSWFGTPNMPPEAKAIMQKAFFQALNSPAYKKDSEAKFSYVSQPLPIEIGEAKMAKIANFEPEMISFLKDFIARGEAARKTKKRGKKKG